MLLGGITALSIIATGLTPAYANGPFDGLDGSWSGKGMLTPVGKSPERTACSRSGSISGGGDMFIFSFSCKSASERIALSCKFSVKAKQEKVSGSCTEQNYGMPMWVMSGKVENGVITIVVKTLVGSHGNVRITKTAIRMDSPDARKIKNLTVTAN